MRIALALLLFALVGLQLRLWGSADGMRKVHELQTAIALQREQNREIEERNRALAAEVGDLKGGLDAIEERARSEMGMIRSGEVFYQIIEHPDPAESAPRG
jgi:cell division protein FtsB